MTTTVKETADFAVTVERITKAEIPLERQEVYFLRHKTYRVVELATPNLVEALVNLQVAQKLYDVAKDDPEAAMQNALGAGPSRMPGLN